LSSQTTLCLRFSYSNRVVKWIVVPGLTVERAGERRSGLSGDKARWFDALEGGVREAWDLLAPRVDATFAVAAREGQSLT
jgi:hypothetical protein